MEKRGKDIIQSVTAKGQNIDVVFQFEKILLLLGNPDVLGLLLSLLFLDQIGFVQFKTQKQLAEILGFSEPTFIKKRKLLETLGLLEVLSRGHVKIINLKFLSRLSNFRLPSDTSKQVEYMAGQAFSLSLEEDEGGQLKIDQLKNFKSSSIYIYNKYINNTNTDIQNKNKQNKIYTEELKNFKSQKIVTFPKADYDFVLSAFKRCKGVGLQGAEIAQHCNAIKTMFKSGRTPKQIVAFMEWMRDHEKDERTGWVKMWTIWTVQKKMPEFLGGKLKLSSTQEEFPRYE